MAHVRFGSTLSPLLLLESHLDFRSFSFVVLGEAASLLSKRKLAKANSAPIAYTKTVIVCYN